MLNLSMSLRIYSSVLVVAGVVAVDAGCSRAASGNAAPPLLEVEVAPVEQKDVPVYREWIGTLDGMVNADIKAEVSGYLTQQAYTEGSFVKKGQLLFQIDPRPFQAALDQAKASSPKRKASSPKREPSWSRPRRRSRWRKRISAALNWMWIATLLWRSSRPSRNRTSTTRPKITGSQGAGAVRSGASGNCAGSDHRRQRRRSIRQGHRRYRPDQPGIYAPHFAYRRYPRHRAAASGFAGQSGQPDHHYRVDA